MVHPKKNLLDLGTQLLQNLSWFFGKVSPSLELRVWLRSTVEEGRMERACQHWMPHTEHAQPMYTTATGAYDWRGHPRNNTWAESLAHLTPWHHFLKAFPLLLLGSHGSLFLCLVQLLTSQYDESPSILVASASDRSCLSLEKFRDVAQGKSQSFGMRNRECFSLWIRLTLCGSWVQRLLCNI